MSVSLKKAIGYLVSDYDKDLQKKVHSNAINCLVKMTNQLIEKFKKHKDRHSSDLRDLKIFLEYECKKNKLQLENFIIETDLGLLITVSDTERGNDGWRHDCSLIETMEYDDSKSATIQPIIGSIYPESWREWYSLASGKKIKEEDRVIFSRIKYKDLESKYQKRFKNYGLDSSLPFKPQCGMQPPVILQMILDCLEIDLKDCKPVILTYIE